MNREDENNIYKKYKAGTTTEEENIQLEAYIEFGEFDEYQVSNLDKIELDKIKSKLRREREVSGRRIRPLRWISVAASLALILGASVYFLKRRSDDKSKQQTEFANDVNPGGNKAILTLGDGKKISLTDAKNGQLATQSGIQLIKTTDGQLTYSIGNTTLQSSAATQYNTIETPMGGFYQITLPDKSKVWLNAASSLKFPTTFTGLDKRKVELSGEAYFEIFKDKKHPFIVTSKQQEITVVGTHFNVNSYPDELKITTTLLEGSVRIAQFQAISHPRGASNQPFAKGVMLAPGQQAVNSGSSIQVKEVETDNVVAWKNNKFVFDNEPLESILKQLARWYNVEFIYENEEVKKKPFGGIISRNTKISKILNKIQLTKKANFKIEGRKIMVK